MEPASCPAGHIWQPLHKASCWPPGERQLLELTAGGSRWRERSWTWEPTCWFLPSQAWRPFRGGVGLCPGQGFRPCQARGVEETAARALPQGCPFHAAPAALPSSSIFTIPDWPGPKPQPMGGKEPSLRQKTTAGQELSWTAGSGLEGARRRKFTPGRTAGSSAHFPPVTSSSPVSYLQGLVPPNRGA